MEVDQPDLRDWGEHDVQPDMLTDPVDPPENTKDEENFLLTGVPLTVKVTVGRQNKLHIPQEENAQRRAMEEARLHHVIWADGTRQQMHCELVNKDEIRGWWARKGSTFAFTAPTAGIRCIDFAMPPIGITLSVWVSWKLDIGQRAWRFTDREYNPQLRSYVDVPSDCIFSGVDDCMVVLTERKQHSDGTVGRNYIEMPISKFIEDFSPCGRTKRNTDSTDGFWVPHWLGASNPRSCLPVKNSFSFTPATLWKIRKQWMKLHLKCEEKKYAPDGLGYTRARVDFEGQREGDGHMLASGLRMRGIVIGDQLAQAGSSSA